MASTDHDISTLNSLIATTLDSVEGYTEAAKDTDNNRFGGMFTSRASERNQVATKLQTEVTRLGGTPADSGTALAGAHRMFVGIKAAVTGKDEQAIVNEVERGEDHIKAKFENAMKDSELSAAVAAIVTEAYGPVKEGHDQMRDLKHAMQAAS